MNSRFLSKIRPMAVVLLATILVWPAGVQGYAVLSHEAIIDAAWESHIKPLLLKKYPQATEEDLSAAQAFAYGGSIIQDMGYYPYGSPFFSDLTHYVRSGDFVQALLRDAQDLTEYAFALGALAHYAADNEGHRIGTNRAVAVLYPGLGKKYGDSVTYEDGKLAHVKTEFGFDVLEIAKERYAPDGYHDFIGFEVAQRVLDQAFRETYGLELKNVLVDEEKALNSYRRDVSKLIPKATRIAWHLKKDEIKDDIPDATKKRFLYNLSKSNYEKEWGKNYKKPTPGEIFLAFLYKLIPKFGPLKVLQFRTPTPLTEHMFEASFNATLGRYRKLLTETGEGSLQLENDNFDVGEHTGPGKYRLNDDAHATLLDKLAQTKFASISAEAKAELLRFYADPDAPYTTKRNAKAWARVQTELLRLQTAPVAPLTSRADAVSPVTKQLLYWIPEKTGTKCSFTSRTAVHLPRWPR
ncbi:MAG TPA: zinc dependent phospholipase C family protein [Candidatus Acidoferrum sp.]|nr:zinc dependent phospholipase C family protein [Candidatus Acidoferrum sp.]